MKLRLHLRCQGIITNGTLQLMGRNVSASTNPTGNVQWYLCGPGAAKEGFRPRQWVAKIDDAWYIRPTGNNGQRGQYRKIQGRWETQMDAATTDQAKILETAANSH